MEQNCFTPSLLLKPCSGILKMPYESGNEVCNASTSSGDIRYFRTTQFLTSRRPFLIIFTTKSYLRSESFTAYKFYALYRPIEDFSEGNFCLCVENTMRVVDPFFLHIKSWYRKTLHI